MAGEDDDLDIEDSEDEGDPTWRPESRPEVDDVLLNNLERTQTRMTPRSRLSQFQSSQPIRPLLSRQHGVGQNNLELSIHQSRSLLSSMMLLMLLVPNWSSMQYFEKFFPAELIPLITEKTNMSFFKAKGQPLNCQRMN